MSKLLQLQGKINMDKNDSPTFQRAVDFCKQWKAGQELFTIHTSGSTGVPKPILISRTQMEASAMMTANALGLSSGDNALVCLNTDYIAGKMMLVRGMVNSFNLYLTPPSAHPLVEVPDDIPIDFMAVVPLQMESIIDSGKKYIAQLNRMKAILIGGAPISYKLLLKVRQLTAPVYATYGMTETVSHIALMRLNGEQPTAYYQVLQGVKIDQDSRGCLTISSILTNHKTIVTNDIVRIINSEAFEWLGRADHVINSGGIKIHPEQLEDQIKQVLTTNGWSINLIIAGLPDEKLGEKIVLLLETEELSHQDLDGIKKILAHHLDKYQVPKEIFPLEYFLYTATGKIKREETVNSIHQNMP